MAITLVGTNTGGNNNGGDCTVNLPGATSQDDVVVVIGGHANSSGNQAGVNTSGYTRVVHLANSTCRLAIEYKVMGGSPDSSVSCRGSGSGVDATAYVVMVFRGVDTSSPIDAPSQSTSGNNNSPNSSAINVNTVGAAVISGIIQAADENNINAPSGYGNKVLVNRTETNPVTSAGAWDTINTIGSENPGAWSSGTSARWVAGTVALTPAAAPPVDGVFTSSGNKGTATFRSFSNVDGVISLTGTGTASFVGGSVSSQPAPFAMTATANVDFSGAFLTGGTVAATGTATVSFVGSTHNMTSVREVVEERGAATVSIGH